MVGKNDFDARMRQVLGNPGAVLQGTGLGFNHIVRFTTYLFDSRDIERFMAIRAELFPVLFGGEMYPPNTLPIVDRLVKAEFPVEIEAVAYADPDGGMRQP